jgi:hypothetical protein
MWRGREEEVRLDTTATGRAIAILCPDCEWDEFPTHAQKAVDDFGLTVTERIDSLTGERLWIAVQGDDQFCISWDHWMREVTIMAWQSTPDAALLALAN